MQSFVIHSGREAKVTFHAPRFDVGDPWLQSYEVQFEAPHLRASAAVENPPYGHPPSALLREIAVQWSGWAGAKSWRAMEGELNISATADSTGHITLHFELPGSVVPPCWSASISVVVEAGQLELLSREANAFFNDGV